MKDAVIKSLSFLGVSEEKLKDIIEVPKDTTKGDYAIPCFTLAKELNQAPQEIAKNISEQVKLSETFEKVESIGPFVNFFLNKTKLAGEVIDRIQKEGDKYGNGKHYDYERMIEFSQANTHKAFHVGHIRGTSQGESLSRLAEACGVKITRSNYQGDTGMHVAKWIWCYKKYHSHEELKHDESWIASIYVDAVKKLGEDEELQKEVDEINVKLDSGEDKELNKLWEETRKLSLNSLEKIYSELNTRFDNYFFESEVEKRAKEISKELVSKKIARVSEKATIMDLEEYGLSVWVLLRSDGTVLYSAKDVALAEKKVKEHNVKNSLIITDSAQDMHFRQLRKTLELMKFPNVENYTHQSYGLVRFPHGRMSSRTGQNILYSNFKKELVDFAAKEIEKREKLETTEVQDRALAISIASIKYAMLKQDANKTIIFDKEKAMRFEGDTGPYLLYSYARAQSILTKANYKKDKKFEINKLEESEKNLIRELAKFPQIVKHSYDNLAPNNIANYAFILAQTYSDFYHKCQVIGSEEEQFRLKLVSSFGQTMKNALYLLGIPVISRM